MFYFLVYLSYSTGLFGYRDSSNKDLVNCSSEIGSDVVIPSTVVHIYSQGSTDFAFKNCRYVIRSLRFEENSQIVSIYSHSFRDSYLESVNLSECKKL